MFKSYHLRNKTNETMRILNVEVRKDWWKFAAGEEGAGETEGADDIVGTLVGADDIVGTSVGAFVGTLVGADDIVIVGASDGDAVGESVGALVGTFVGACDGGQYNPPPFELSNMKSLTILTLKYQHNW